MTQPRLGWTAGTDVASTDITFAVSWKQPRPCRYYGAARYSTLSVLYPICPSLGRIRWTAKDSAAVPFVRGRKAKGIYAISVSGRLPMATVRELKSRGITYKSRDTSTV
ncbi:hypothetical protein MRX96_033403 [Rhipicephalus microplus]